MANNNDLFSIATGYFGSAYLDATSGDEGVKNLSATGDVPHHVVAITMLQECTFTKLQAYVETSKYSAYITTQGTPAFSSALATSDTFPTGVTIYGRWDDVELNTGKCIAYVAPTSGAHPGLNTAAS